MKKSESKYFNTALRMDEALIALLEVKDLEYISVKEICERAGVNRSTFYLHYETIADLVDEAMESVNRRFLSYFGEHAGDFISEIEKTDLKDLVLITPDYLRPYLKFISEHKQVYRAAFRNPNGMQANAKYRDLKRYVLEPILERFGIQEPLRQYYIAFYIEGIIAIIKQWLCGECREPVETIAGIIEACVRPSEASAYEA